MIDFIKDADCTKETHSLACVGRIKQQYIQYLLVSSTQMTYTQMIGIILLVHFMVLTVVHVRKKVVM